tara:strand:- start:16892 stop:17782 length:891 start_codon:yes stop_codon:yes gene_type:complete
MKVHTRRKLKCHPKIGYTGNGNNPKVNGNYHGNKYQCYPDDAHDELKKIWNRRYAGIKSKKIYTSDNRQIKEKLYEHNPECNNDVCILKNVLPKKDLKKMLSFYAPIANWKRDPQKWLNTTDIENVLKQYEEVFPSYYFLGVCPIDWESRVEEEHECICKKLCELSLENEQQKGYTKIASVFNLDEHDEPGSHWVATYIDIPSQKMYYFDSEGLRCPTRIKKIYHNLKKYEENSKLKFYSNYGVVHQKSNHECGMYCIYFILHMIQNNDFGHFTDVNAIISDEEMGKLRDKYFNVL